MASIADALDAERETVLATIIDVEGSAYRRPGAKMVVDEGGEGVGSITAGCLEDEVLKLASQVLSDGERHVETFDLMGDDDGDSWGLGLGCNGIIDVLLEPLDETYRPVVDAYEAGDDIVTLTVLNADGADVAVGARLLAPDGMLPGRGADAVADWPDWVLDGLADPVVDLLRREKSDTVRIEHEGASVEVFVDSVTAPPELVVFGSGHDVGPVTELAKNVDFRVTVCGFRGGTATEERFPEADHVVSTSPPRIGDVLSFDDDTYAVVMTHNFIDDRLTLESLIDTPVPYIGLMGPTERFEEMLEAFEAEGTTLDDDDVERIYTPIGLNLGSGTPYGIAHSIVAEVMAVRNGRDPGHLRGRKSPIHERIDIEKTV